MSSAFHGYTKTPTVDYFEMAKSRSIVSTV